MSLPAAQLKLSISLGVGSFDYIISETDNKLRVFKSYGTEIHSLLDSFNELEVIIQKDQMLTRSYPQVHLSLMAPEYTLVPSKLFSSEDATSYLDQVSETRSDYSVRHELLSEIDCYAVFKVPHVFEEWASHRFPNARFSHLMSLLIPHALQSSAEEKDRLYIHWNRNQLAIVLIQGQQLEFSNIFEIPTEEQLIYVLGLVSNQFRINQLQIPVYLSGDIRVDDPFFETIGRYLPNLRLTALPKEVLLPSVFAKAPIQQLVVPTLGL